MGSLMLRWAAALCVVLAAVTAAPLAEAQAPASPEVGEIAACLCLQQAVDASAADMNGRQQAYAASQSELARIDAEMQSERARMDVNNPQSVAQFRQLLERRDAAFRRSTSLATGDLHSVTERYNARVSEYNARCANRPRDPRLLQGVQATLACPPPY
jgi:Skp family chaperone for outer membrane proteins